MEQYMSQFQMISNRILQLKLQNSLFSISDTKKYTRHLNDMQGTICHLKKRESDYFGVIQLEVSIDVVECAEDGTEKSDKHCAIETTIEGGFIFHFGDNEEPDEIKIKEMLMVNGMTALYSILRGIIASITAQSFANGSILLPMINVAAYCADTKEPGDAEENK